ncbi:MAG: sigma-70 family RNA polymerase sigma factor [Anaerolineae bacterium]|nr:sigma-70 family RNA polymerase sigma factor [Anaerolineae bacterium]
MDTTTDLTTEELAQRCQEESRRRIHQSVGAASSCWELFRRALDQGDEQAWRALFAQYRLLVLSWASELCLEPDDLMTEVLARFWVALRNRDFASHFPTIGQVMRYLKRCTRAYAMDWQRATRRRTRRQASWSVDETPLTPSYEDDVLRDVDVKEFRTLLHSKLKDDLERLVFEQSYEHGLKPREIAAGFPEMFEDGRRVSAIKARVLSRLLDDPKVQQWKETWTGHPGESAAPAFNEIGGPRS